MPRTNKPLLLTADEILSIPLNQPERLFNYDTFEEEMKRLRTKWHPDHNAGTTTDVARHVNVLIDAAQRKIKEDRWETCARLVFTVPSTGKKYALHYGKLRPFELGDMAIGRTKVAFIIKEENKDLYENGLKMIKNIKYKDKKLETEFSRRMPHIEFAESADIGYVVIMKKPEDFILLQDLIEMMPDEKVEPVHAAWIGSSLYNLTVFFEVHKICHNGITPLSAFVSTEGHDIILLGGWWYATNVGNKLIALPAILQTILPKEVFEDKKAKTTYDRLAVKATVLATLGDHMMNGSSLLKGSNVPKPMLLWLRNPYTGDAISEYHEWYNVLEKSFGPRKFIKFDADTSNIY